MEHGGERFDIFSKVSVDVGSKCCLPLYKYLANKVKHGGKAALAWNYTKFLINKKGVPVKRFEPGKDVNVKDVEKQLCM